MSSHSRQKRKRKKIPRTLLIILIIICGGLIVLSRTYSSASGGPASIVAGYVIVPIQKGLKNIGNGFSGFTVYFKSKKDLQTENEQLREKVDDLRSQINEKAVDQHEYEQLQEMYQTDQKFSEYRKVAADVIASDSGNWFSSFLINKGTDDGIKIGMNVIAQGALVGIVTDTGPEYAKIRSVIDDTSSVSAMDTETSDLCIVSGSLKTMTDSQMIEFKDMQLDQSKKDSGASDGDLVVTSSISDRFLKGIPIGYISGAKTDTGGLSQSGSVIPIVDFQHLEHVFVILTTKSTDSGN